jgi:hypothetical protein
VGPRRDTSTSPGGAKESTPNSKLRPRPIGARIARQWKREDTWSGSATRKSSGAAPHFFEREKVEIDALIAMEAPTKPMLKEAADAGLYQPPAFFRAVGWTKLVNLRILKIAACNFSHSSDINNSPRAFVWLAGRFSATLVRVRHLMQ